MRQENDLDLRGMNHNPFDPTADQIPYALIMNVAGTEGWPLLR